MSLQSAPMMACLQKCSNAGPPCLPSCRTRRSKTERGSTVLLILFSCFFCVSMLETVCSVNAMRLCYVFRSVASVVWVMCAAGRLFFENRVAKPWKRPGVLQVNTQARRWNRPDIPKGISH